MKRIIYNLILILLLIPITSYANTDIGNIEVRYSYNEVNLSNIESTLYRIGDIDSLGNATIYSNLSKYNITVYTNPNLILSYVLENNISPYKEIVSNKEGISSFNNIPRGLYILKSSKLEYNNYLYKIEPTIIGIPNDNTYNYTINSKISRTKIEEEILYTSKQIIVGWNDNNNKLSLRPKMMMFKLLRDGVPYKEITLSEENNWTYTWNDLPLKDESGVEYVYTVVSADMENYNTTLNEKDNTFNIINNIIEDKEVIKEDNLIKDTKLPTISILWWPIPVFLFLGTIFLSIGITKFSILKKNNGRNYILISNILIFLGFILLIYNITTSFFTKEKANKVYNELSDIISSREENTNYKNNKYIDLPSINIDKYNYSGYISIPSLNFKTPVIDNYDDSYNLPAVLYGTPYLNNLYICSKNYYELYQNLNKLTIGNIITFTDVDGNVFIYKVEEINTVDNKDIDSELQNNMGLMLFTSEIYSINKVLFINCSKVN